MHSTRRGFGLFCVMIGVVVVAAASELHAQSRAFPASPRAASVSRQTADSAATRRALLKAIERFQNRWRSEWQRAEVARHAMINLAQIRGFDSPGGGDRAAMNMTTELRRYLAILCIIDSPSDVQLAAVRRGARPEIARSREPNLGTNVAGIARRIHDPRGSVCPQWAQEDEDTPLDEGESIDLALPLLKRRDIARARELLLEQLDKAQAEFPGDSWITGQRVRFAMDQRQASRALEAAQSCSGDRVYCARLAGLTYDFLDSMHMADAMYRVADSLERAAPPGDGRLCLDADVLLLLSKKDSASVRNQSCAEQRQFVDQLWWMADPLWSEPGNERLVAHWSRQTHLSLRAALDRDERYVWWVQGGGLALRAMLMRYGWPSYTYWPGGTLEEEISKYREEKKGVLWFVAPPYTAKEYSPDRQAVIPTFSAITNPLRARATDWQTTAPEGTPASEWWPSEHMKLWTTLRPLPSGQRAVLRRDSAVVLAWAIDDPIAERGADAEAPWTATLMGATSPADIRVLAQTTVLGNQTLRLLTAVSSEPMVLSNEVRDLDSRGATFRLREGFAPPPTLSDMARRDAAMSPPVFVRLPQGVTDAPADPDSAVALMSGSLTLDRTSGIAVYWESYGFAPGDTIDVQLRVIRDEQSGVARTIAERLGVLDDRRDSISVSWREPERQKRMLIGTRTLPTLSRSVLLNLRQLPVGQYRLFIEMTRIDGLRTQSEQVFRLRD